MKSQQYLLFQTIIEISKNYQKKVFATSTNISKMENTTEMEDIEEIMWADDDEFEKVVKDLDLRGILGLMEALQTAMRKEQLHFEELSLQLQNYPDRNSYNHRKISAALCSTQRLLTNLCTKHMMCSGQRSLRSSFSESCPTVESVPVVKVSTMSSSTIRNGGDRTNGFKESLRFFQSQVEKTSVPHGNEPNNVYTRKSQQHDHKQQNGSDVQNKANLRTTNSVPSVDNILSNVKTLVATRNGKSVSDESSYPSVHRSNDCKMQPKIVPVVFQTPDSRRSEGVTRSEQVSVNDKVSVAERHKRSSLLSNFNPMFDPDEDDQQAKKTTNESKDIFSSSHHSHTVYDSKKSSQKISKTESLTDDFKQKLSFENINVTSCLKSINNWTSEQGSVQNCSSESETLSVKQAENSRTTTSTYTNRTFGQCKEKLSQMELNNKTSVKNILPTAQDIQNENIKPSESPTSDISKREDDESISEKQSDSFESDYDSQDFVVHKATFPEDYLEAISEDNYSSVNEDYEVEHPEEQIRGPDIPSPDYVSDEEEYRVQHEDDAHYDDVEFIDNTAQYMNDPRRYIYYPDDKELEVIPEEDEDDIEEYEEMYSHEDSYKLGGYHVSNQSSDDSRYNNHGECDSGLTDDQRSSSSTAEECELEDDTDSAKGSLPLQDSSSESPTYNERANMFQNVEYHKKKRSTPHKRIIEDYEKPKVNGKNVDTISIIYQNGEDDEIRQARNLTSSWDPQELLKVLYRLDFPTEPLKKQTRYINKEGYLEKLPSGRKKATYWNPWKTKYIKLKDGFLYCYDNNHSDKAIMTLQLMGGHIYSLESKMIGVDDQKGHYVVLRCSNEEEAESWENALQSHCSEDFVNAYTSPCLHPLKTSKNILVIDLGSCSVRAGILMSSPSLPQLFFPTVCATNKHSQKKIFGNEALKPSVRKDCHLSFPLHPSAKVTKYSIDVSILPDLLKHIFRELNVYPEDYKIQLSMPRNLSLQTKLKIACMLLDDFKVKGINLTHQAILSLHAYNSKSGVIVDIGDRLDVIPIIEGYIVESGVTRLPYGGQRMIHHLKHALAEKNISVVSDVETYLARYILEQLCYVAEDYTDELQRYHTNPDDFEMSISTSHFFKEDNMWDEVILDLGRFHVPEGLFTPEKWGIDNPGLHKLVHHAIQECGVDLRREMSRSIYVSGGLTLLPGFAERLENEVDKLTPNTITPKVHASPYRYHMSYIGACQIALGDKFDEICLTKQIWKKEGNTCVKKWHI